MRFAALAAGWEAGVPAESLGFGLTVAAIGIGVVFAVLLLLYGLMVLIGSFARQTQTEAPGVTGAAAPGVPPRREPARPEPGRLEPDGADPAEHRAPVEAAVETRLAAAIAGAVVAAQESPRVPENAPAGDRGPGWGKLTWTLSGRIDLLTAREKLPRG